jgi:hypothetical protein
MWNKEEHNISTNQSHKKKQWWQEKSDITPTICYYELSMPVQPSTTDPDI